jgi:hypothetical protein
MIWVETCDGAEELGYLTQEDADADECGKKPWLAKARRPKMNSGLARDAVADETAAGRRGK